MTSGTPIRACLITNPRGGKGELDLSPVLPILAGSGWEVSIQQKRHGGHASELAAKAAKEGYDIVVACGGDGTVSEIVDGLAGTNVAIGVLPGGTANLWAHEIGVSLDLERAARQLVTAQRRRADVGHFTINGKKGQHFMLMAGLGLDANVVDRLSKPLKKRVGMLSYLPAILKVIPKRPNYDVRIDLDGVSWQGRAAQIVIGNTRRYASVTNVTSEARVDDGRFDIAILAPPHALSVARQLITLVTRKRPSLSTAHYDRVGSVRIQAGDVIPLEVDGGRVKQTKVKPDKDGVTYEFSIRTQAITMLVPREYSGTLFQDAVLPLAGDSAARLNRPKKHTYRVLAVGVGIMQVVRLRDARTLSVSWGPGTETRDADGQSVPLEQFVAALNEGVGIHVKGARVHPGHDLMAKSMRIEPEA
jgi:YegS/Rv2252/BmrU family lipid kinase